MQKISIITSTFNSVKTLERTILSVIAQDHALVEYIVIDGGSTDGTIELINSYKQHIHFFISEKDKGIYDGLNKGIMQATGDVIGFLHSDDHFANDKVISRISAAFDKEGDIDAVYGDILFFNMVDGKEKKVRSVKSDVFTPFMFRFGMMPAHPTFYAKADVYKKFGLFDLAYKISADFDFLLRVMLLGKIKTKYLPGLMVKMLAGGTSTKNLKSNLTLNREILRSCKRHKVYTNYFMIYAKYMYKVFQLGS